jgi:hypothetical protein
MTIELDHFFILTEPGSPQADLVSSIGLIEGTRNIHPGQGTANRRFFFSNSTLEFLYIRDAEEAEKGRGSRLRFTERVTSANASPFGLIVRTASGSTDIPFPGWKYCPEYFRDDQCFHVGESSDVLEEPLCIRMPSNLPQRKHQPRPENPLWTMTELRISVPVVRPSPTLQAVSKCKGVLLRLDEPHRLELVFNGEKEGQSKDMTPDLPLIVRW